MDRWYYKIKLFIEWLITVNELSAKLYPLLAEALLEALRGASLRALRKRKNFKLKLPHFLLLVMDPDRVEERLGDLEEKKCRIAQMHSSGYADFWYVWMGFWVFAAAIAARLPGKFLLDALKNRVSKD